MDNKLIKEIIALNMHITFRCGCHDYLKPCKCSGKKELEEKRKLHKQECDKKIEVLKKELEELEKQNES